MPYLLYKAFKLDSISSFHPFNFKITKSKLVSLHNEQIQSHVQKIRALTQNLGSISKFWLKVEPNQIFSECSFSKKNYKDIENLILLGDTKVFNLKSNERIINLLNSSRYDNQFCGSGASEAPAQA